MRDAVGVAQPAGAVGVERTGDQPGAGAGDAEPGAFLVAEVDDARAAGAGPKPAARSASSAAQRADHAERPVERAAVRARSRGGCR